MLGQSGCQTASGRRPLSSGRLFLSLHNPMATRATDNGSHSKAHRVIASMNREQVDFLDKIGKDAMFSSGLKLTRTQILAAMVNVLTRLNLNGDGIRTTEQFEQRIVDAITR